MRRSCCGYKKQESWSSRYLLTCRDLGKKGGFSSSFLGRVQRDIGETEEAREFVKGLLRVKSGGQTQERDGMAASEVKRRR